MFYTTHLIRRVSTASEGAEQTGIYTLIGISTRKARVDLDYQASISLYNTFPPLLLHAQFFLTAASLKHYPPGINRFWWGKKTPKTNLEHCCIQSSTCPPGSFQVANMSFLQQWRRWNLAYLVASCLLLAHLAAPLLSTANNSRDIQNPSSSSWSPESCCHQTATNSEFMPLTTGFHTLITQYMSICSLSLVYSYSHSHLNHTWVTNPSQLLLSAPQPNPNTLTPPSTHPYSPPQPCNTEPLKNKQYWELNHTLGPQHLHQGLCNPFTGAAIGQSHRKHMQRRGGNRMWVLTWQSQWNPHGLCSCKPAQCLLEAWPAKQKHRQSKTDFSDWHY